MGRNVLSGFVAGVNNKMTQVTHCIQELEVYKSWTSYQGFVSAASGNEVI